MQYYLEPYNLLTKLLPPVQKKIKFKEFLKVVSKPLQSLNEMFVVWANRMDYLQRHNGQVICLENILNNEFMGADIFIVDGVDELPSNYIYQSNGQNDIYIYPESYTLPYDETYLFTQQEYDNYPHFIVYCKQAVYDAIVTSNDIERFKSLIDERKIIGKKYQIKPY
jgi:hypothetical protein